MDAHLPARYDLHLVNAMLALQSGVANEGQQKAALDWIITQASNYYDLSYRPGDPTATSFHEGRRFVGAQIVKMLRPETLKALNRRSDSQRPQRSKRQEANND